MANANVVADVGETLVELIKSGVVDITENVRLTSADEMRTLAPGTPAVTVFLYHVAVNAELRNQPPRVGADGSLTPPPLPLELRYLVTPWAREAASAHRLIGRIMRVLYENAALTFGDLKGSSWRADDTLQFTPEPVPVAEHHDIWEPAGIPYKLSVAYVARVVGLDARATVFPAPVVSVTVAGP